MPLRSGALTPIERNIAETMAELGDVQLVSVKLSVSDRTIRYALQRPEVQALIAAQQRALVVTELLPLANKAMRQVLESDRTPAAARVAAAKLVYDRAWGADAAAAGKQPHEMSRDELGAAIARLEAAAAERAKDVTPSKPAVFD